MAPQENQNGKSDLLLHICCAPCSTHPIDLLKEKYQVTGLFYGPNIHPEIEYIVRLEEAERFTGLMGIELIRAEYDLSNWFALMEGREKDMEGGECCKDCIAMRLDKTAEYALEKEIPLFSTTLSVSPHKNSDDINSIGLQVGEKYGLDFYQADFKKKDGFRKSLEISKQYDLYHQDYCGCVYSRRERRGKNS
jgi:predicted adenine nucleotide alpha hydrolase (AANH) superfamily ATPase